MPWGDQTGPAGRGIMTGRGMGFCAGFDAPGNMSCGFGRGRRMGRRFRGRFQAPSQQPYPTRFVPREEKEMLNEEVKILEQEKQAIEQDLKDIEKRLKELK